MNIPEEFGSYLLLKKLTEDALGETFRAGKVGDGGMEQVVLLRVLNGKGMDGDKLWAKVSGRAAVQQALKSPNIGGGVDLGRVRNYAYAAYDYISGKNLAVLFAQAAKQGSPIPADHAMLIAERISLALASAYESRVADERILHGFVVPHLVMISNEGEARLLGFELAPGLRELAAGGWRDAELTPYLSPETLAGQPLSRADDVWSLGALLLEMLTGERLAGGDPGAAIDAAVVANEGTPLPAPLAALLKKSLVPRGERIADAVTWHKAISKLMIEGHYSPTTFNLAFFMHNLFRDEIERESEEIQAEKRYAASAPPPSAAPAAVARPAAAAAAAAAGRQAADGREKAGVREATLPGVAAAKPAAGGGKGVWIAIAAALAIAVLGGGGWFLFGRKPAPPPAPAAAAQPVAAPLPALGAAAPAAPKPEEIQAQITAMFDARSKEMEAKLKDQYDERIKALQKQLQDSKKETSSTHAAGASPAAAETRVARAEAPPVVPESAPPPAVPSPSPAPAAGAAVPAPAGAKSTAAAASPATSAPSVAAATPPPAADAEPAPPKVQLGDLVQPGPGVVAPKMAGMPEPRYPSAARHMNKSADVQIRVLVDELGRVVQTQPVGAKVGFGFDEAAMEAARHSSYRPATKDGVRVKMWTVMRVAFKPT